MRTLDQDIIISTTDLQRLLPLLDSTSTAVSESLQTEIDRATVVDAQAIPPDVVTMGSEVVYEDCETSSRRTVTLAYPGDADATRGIVSVLAPIGSALLGLRVNQTITWRVPSGTKRLRVVEVRHPHLS